MNLSYHKWLEIEIRNDYFTDGLCPVIRLEPFTETARKMTHYQTLMRRESASFFFYIGLQSDNETSLFEALEGIDVMHFQILVEDLLFYDYTNLPAASEQSLALFSNTAGTTQMQKNTFVSASDIVPIKQSDLGLDSLQENDLIQIKDSTGLHIIQETTYRTTVSNETAGYPPVNLATLPPNKYQLWLNNEQQGNSFYHFDTQLANNCIGVAQIDMATILHEANQNLKLVLAYKGKEVYWKYKIVIPKNRTVKINIENVKEPASNASLSDENPASYIYEGTAILSGDQIAHVYVSQKPKQLQKHLKEHPTLTYSYQDPNSNSMQTDVMKLPNPSPAYLEEYIMLDGTKIICATTIVYI